jgi:hypothetical protein
MQPPQRRHNENHGNRKQLEWQHNVREWADVETAA